MVYWKRAAIMKDPFNGDFLSSNLCKYRTLIARSQLFVSVPWRENEPIANTMKERMILFCNKKTKIR